MKQHYLLSIFLLLSLQALPQAHKPVVDSLNQLLENTSETKQKVDLLNEIAFEYINIQIDTSYIYAQKAQELAQHYDYQLGVADAKKNLATYYHMLNDRKKTFKYFNEAVAIVENEKDSTRLAKIYNNIGITYKNHGDFNEALDAYHKALAINLKRNNLVGTLRSYKTGK